MQYAPIEILSELECVTAIVNTTQCLTALYPQLQADNLALDKTLLEHNIDYKILLSVCELADMIDRIVAVLAPFVVVFELLMLLICVLGDRAISSSVLAQWMRALADASTHGAVGALSWAIVCVGQFYSDHPLFEVALSGALAVGVDVDHFIATWSLSLQAALSLTKRGAFHNSTLIPVITGLLFIGLKYLCPLKLYPVFANVPLIFFISWSSHHIRDATRRGLWFAPFGSSPPLPTWLYRSLVAGMPLLLRLIMILRHGRSQEESNVQQPSILMSVV